MHASNQINKVLSLTSRSGAVICSLLFLLGRPLKRGFNPHHSKFICLKTASLLTLVFYYVLPLSSMDYLCLILRAKVEELHQKMLVSTFIGFHWARVSFLLFNLPHRYCLPLLIKRSLVSDGHRHSKGIQPGPCPLKEIVPFP